MKARAKAYEAARTHAEAQDGNFDLAEVFLQLAIVLGSVAILAVDRRVFWASGVAAAVGAILTLIGFFLLFALPFQREPPGRRGGWLRDRRSSHDQPQRREPRRPFGP